jgi:glycosyltransferase involved in cell wall biosynthesis
MKTKITYIISFIDKALEFEQVAGMLDREKFELSFILLNPGASELETFIAQQDIPVHRIPYSGKKDLPAAIFRIYRLLRKISPHIVHTHLFDASVAGLIAAKLAGVRSRIQTRHHSDYHHAYFPSAVKYDKLNNRLSTHIIAVSGVVKKILTEKEGVDEKKISILHHGIDSNAFNTIAPAALKELSVRYNPLGKKPVVGVISRYIELKGIQYIVPAFKKLLETHPGALLILANARGSYAPEIRKLLSTLPPGSYTEIGFEKDIFTLYRLFDTFVHVPVSRDSEAFGQTYIESLASGIPSVFTISGIAGDFITDKKNALTVPYRDSNAIHAALLSLLRDEAGTAEMIAKGKQDVAGLFSIEKKIRNLEKIYLNQK